MKGYKVLITAGPTKAKIDPVRYITNISTGKLGAKIADVFLKKEATVNFLYGEGSVLPKKKSKKLCLKNVETVKDLIKIIKQDRKKYDIIIHSMAVLDYIPKNYSEKKIPSKRKNWVIKLTKTPKVIKLIKKLHPKSFLVGFKLEVNKKESELVKIGRQFLKANKLDLIVVNDLKKIKRKQHLAYIINKKGEIESTPTDKNKIAEELVKIIKRKLT